MPRLKRRAPGSSAASLWWRTRCASWRSTPGTPRPKLPVWPKSYPRNVAATVSSLGEALGNTQDNIIQLGNIASDAETTSVEAQNVQQSMHTSVGLMASQEQAVAGITSAANGVVDLAGKTRNQSTSLHDLSGTLNVSSQKLNEVVSQFCL